MRNRTELELLQSVGTENISSKLTTFTSSSSSSTDDPISFIHTLSYTEIYFIRGRQQSGGSNSGSQTSLVILNNPPHRKRKLESPDTISCLYNRFQLCLLLCTPPEMKTKTLFK